MPKTSKLSSLAGREDHHSTSRDFSALSHVVSSLGTFYVRMVVIISCLDHSLISFSRYHQLPLLRTSDEPFKLQNLGLAECVADRVVIRIWCECDIHSARASSLFHALE